jgi:hypothetical protein
MNTLADFPPDRFAIIAHCTCGHSGQIDTTVLPPDLPMSVINHALRCSACGGRASGVRIIWTAAGGYAHAG